MKRYKTRVTHPDGFLQQSTLIRKDDGYGPKDLPTSTEAQFSRLTRRTNKFGSSFATVADLWRVVNVMRPCMGDYLPVMKTPQDIFLPSGK